MTRNEPREAVSRDELQHLAVFAQTLVDHSRRVILDAVAGGFAVKMKRDGSFVTSTDVDVEDALRALITDRYPSHGIVGEEQPAVNPAAEYQWILDPIDGTEDFVQRMPTFGTIVGLHYQGLPVVGIVDHPMLDLRLSASYGGGTWRNGKRVRVSDFDPTTPDENLRLMLCARANFIRHSDGGPVFDHLTRRFPNHRIYRSCYAHACAVSGQVDVMVEYGNRIWDLAAAQLLTEEAGGAYRLVQDQDIPGTGRVLGAVFGAPEAVTRAFATLTEPYPIC